MELPVERWFAAIGARTSRRSYEPTPPDEPALARLQLVCREFRPFSEARVELVREPVGSVSRGILGNYGRVTGAPCYLAFIGRTDSERAQECIGYYTGEGLVLEATALGLGTCWVGGLFKSRTAASAVGLDKNERIVAVSPVGRPKGKLSLTDRTFKAMAGSKSRKPLEELVTGGAVAGRGLREALEAARSAPSAVNRQPWRFRVEPGAVAIAASGGRDGAVSNRLDCGIAMLHFELGARAAGLTGRWEFLPSPDVARFILDGD